MGLLFDESFHSGSDSLHPCLCPVSLTGLRPGAAEEVVDEGGGVADVDVDVLVAVGIVEVDGTGVAAQQVVDKGGNVTDIDLAVAVQIASAITLTFENQLQTRQGVNLAVGAEVCSLAAVGEAVLDGRLCHDVLDLPHA